MPKTKKMPKFPSYDEASEWLDTHSTADLETTPVDFELQDFTIRIIDKLDELEMPIILDATLSRRISKIARDRNLLKQDLIVGWLNEKVQEYHHQINDKT